MLGTPRVAEAQPLNPFKRLVRRGLGFIGYEIRRKTPRPAVARPEPTQQERIALDVIACLRAEDADCVLDVGAHLGEFGEALRGAGWTGPIVSFEPVSSSFEQLRGRAAEDPRWTVQRMALGRSRETATIGVTAGTNLSSFLDLTDLATTRWPELAQRTGSEQVEVYRLDDVLSDAVAPLDPRRIFLKLDTQGFDLEVFAGAAGSMDRIVGLLAEVSFQPVYRGMPHYLDALAEFERAGFTPVGFYPITRDGRRRLIEADCLMVRRPAAASPATATSEV